MKPLFNGSAGHKLNRYAKFLTLVAVTSLILLIFVIPVASGFGYEFVSDPCITDPKEPDICLGICLFRDVNPGIIEDEKFHILLDEKAKYHQILGAQNSESNGLCGEYKKVKAELFL